MTNDSDAGSVGVGADPGVGEVSPSSRAGDRTRPATTGPDACSVMWDGSDAPAWGSAAMAGFFVALQQSGPWGRSALTQSRLDPQLGTMLEAGCADAGGRALLIRASGRSDPVAHRQVYVSGGMLQGRPWLLAGHVDRPEELLSLPFEAVAAGDIDAVRGALPSLRPLEESVLLVCAHSKRDICCAVRGRPVAAQAARAYPGRVWECSHTGGHRFAPTAVALPSGATLARLDDDLADESLATPLHILAEPLTGPRHLRGLAHLPLAEQAADAFVRGRTGTLDVTALTTSVHAEQDDGVEVRVEHRDGRSWLVLVVVEPDVRARTNSCGSAPAVTNVFAVRELA